MPRPSGQSFACSEACRNALLAGDADSSVDPSTRVIAVLNQKGGTGKTTTAVSIAAGLAARGRRVLLVDADPQGSVGVSLGVRGDRGLYEVMVDGDDPSSVVLPARANLSVVLADRRLSSVDVILGRIRDRWRVMARAFRTITGRFDCVLIDCAPTVSLMGHNALAYARELIVPVSCDYLALMGVKEVLRTVQHVNDSLDHPIRVAGVLPTFFDARNRICQHAVAALDGYFGDRVMPAVRASTAFKEAPSVGQTIFEHEPRSRGAADYRKVIDWMEKPSDDASRVAPPTRDHRPARVAPSM